jgi:hypothetical protein
MAWIHKLLIRLRSLFHRDRFAKDLDREIQFHLDDLIAENIGAGMSAEEAKYAAMRDFCQLHIAKGKDTRSVGLDVAGTNRPGHSLWLPSAKQQARVYRGCDSYVGAGHRCERRGLQRCE